MMMARTKIQMMTIITTNNLNNQSHILPEKLHILEMYNLFICLLYKFSTILYLLNKLQVLSLVCNEGHNGHTLYVEMLVSEKKLLLIVKL